MYADRVVAGSKRSVRDRLNGNTDGDFVRTTRNSGKRQRQSDDKWKHDLYDDDEEPQVSNPKVGNKDLRLKLQKKGLRQAYQGGNASLAGRHQDLREKLSGTMHTQPAKADPPKAMGVADVPNPPRGSVPAEVPKLETKKVTNPTSSRKKSEQKAEASVSSLLHSLGLEKYLITFQAEEIDMTALMHMNDDDLKALGIPMGPRKKIILALDSRA